MQTQVISKKSVTNTVTTDSINIKLPDSSIVLVDIAPEEVQEIIVNDNQVVIKLKNGETLTIENFKAEYSDLVFRANDKELFLLDFAQVEYNPVESVQALLTSGSSNLLTINGWMAGGALVAGVGIIAAASSGGSNGGSSSVAPADPLVDKQNLSKAIQNAEESLKQFDGIENKIVLNAIDNAKRVLDDANATQQAINQAVEELNKTLKDAQIQEDLEDAAQKRLEDATLAAQKDLDNNLFDGQEKTDVNNAIIKAKDIINNPNSTAEDFNKAKAELDNVVAEAKAAEVLEDAAQKKLEDAIALAKQDLEKNVFDGLEKTIVENAIKDAELILNNPNSTTQNFEKAKAELDKIVADEKIAENIENAAQKQLEDAIALAKQDLENNVFDGQEKTDVENAIKAVELILNNPESSTEEFEAAKNYLNKVVSDAKLAEESESDRDSLQDAIADAQKEVDFETFDGAELELVKNAIVQAKAVLNNVNSTSTDFEKARVDLNKVVADAKAAEVLEDAAQKQLEDAIALAKQDLDNNLFDGQEKTNVENAIKDAELILNNPNSTTQNFEKAKAELDKVVAEAKLAEELESAKESLESAINDARDDIELGTFDGDELKNVQDAIKDAEIVLNDPKSTDQDYKNAEDELKQIVADAKNAEELESAKDSLLDSITDAKDDVNSGIFDGNELKKVEDAIRDAEAILNNPNSNNDDYKKAEETLDQIVNDAKTAEELESAKESLADSIADAKAVVASGLLNGAELKLVEDAILVAEQVLTDPLSTDQIFKNAEGVLDQVVSYAKASELLTIDTLNPTSDNTPLISGSALKDSYLTVEFEVNGKMQSITVQADADGKWTMTADVLPDGVYTVNAYVSDKNGSPLGPIKQASSLIIDTVAPTSLKVALELDSGKPGDGITNNGKVLVLDVEANAVWSYSVDAGKTWAEGSGDHFNLAEGSYSNVLVKQTDIAGNVQSVSLGKIVVDNTNPVIETFTISANNSLVSGKAEAGTEITITQLLGEQTTSQKVVVNQNGEFSLALNPIPKNGEVLTAVATDAAGNESPVKTILTPVLSDQIINLADNTTVLTPDITPTVIKPIGNEVLQNKTALAIASVGLGPVLSADVLTKVLSNSLKISVAEDNIRNVTLKSQSGGISIGSMYDLVVYRKDESSGEYKQYQVEEQWLKAYLLGGVSEELTLSLPKGEYLVFLTPAYGLTVLSGYTLQVLNDDILDYSNALSAEGSTAGNVITDIDQVNGIDIVPTDTILNSITIDGVTTSIEITETAVKGLYGTLYVKQDGSYRYELDSDFKGSFGQTEHFIYTVKSPAGDTASAKLDITITNKAPEPQQITINDTIVIMPEPVITSHPKPIDKLSNIKVLDISLLDPIIKADAIKTSDFMNFTVDSNTVRELTLQGDGGGVSLTTYSLYIYRLDEVTNQYVQYHTEKNWYTVVLGGKSVELPLKFTEGTYIATVVPTGINVLGGASLFVNKDTLYDYNIPLESSIRGESIGDVTLNPNDVLITINNKQFNGSPLEINGQYGVLKINTDGTYNYLLNPVNAGQDAPYGKIESFTYVVRNKDGSTRLDNLNIKIDLASLKDDVNVDVVNLINKTETYVDQATLDIGLAQRKINATFKVLEDVASKVMISFESTLSLSSNRNVEFVVRDSLGKTVQTGTLNNSTGKILDLGLLASGTYTVEATLINPGLAYFSDSTITFQNTYLNIYEAKGIVPVQGNVASNDIGSASIISYTVNGQTASAYSGKKEITVEGQFGTLVLKHDGSYTYTPSGKAFGVETFDYIAETVVGTNSSASLVIQVPKNVTGSEYQDVVESSAADDSYTMGAGADTLIFNVLDQLDATGGNGLDTWADFNIGLNADVIDVSALLVDQNITDISKYISVSFKDQNTIVSIDRDGQSYEADGVTAKADQYEATELLILQNTNISLDDLLKNNQLLF